MVVNRVLKFADLIQWLIGIIFSVASILFFHYEKPFLGIICLIITFFVWTFSIECALAIVLSLILVGIIEMMSGNIIIGVLLLVIAVLAFFIKHSQIKKI